jgi:8-oxo-dGTP pyrophosphatase MutT (NUDIX family)
MPEVLLIEKDRPEWQKNRLNLPGGSVEEGESPEDAAKREIVEETGLNVMSVCKMGEIHTKGSVIHCFTSYLDSRGPLNPREGETEKPVWMPLYDALQDSRLIPNLRVIIPLLRMGVSGWIVSDDETISGLFHTFSVTMPTRYKS